jgi:hypothetical protein
LKVADAKSITSRFSRVGTWYEPLETSAKTCLSGSCLSRFAGFKAPFLKLAPPGAGFVDRSPMRAAGFKNSTEKARRYLLATVGNKAPSELQDGCFEPGRIALDHLLEDSVLST